MGDMKKAEYSNWMPLYLVMSCAVISVAVVVVTVSLFCGVFGTLYSVPWSILKIVAAALSVFCIIGTVKFAYARYAYSYDGPIKLSKRIIEYVAERVFIPAGGIILDIGCGSGALSIACAKRNPRATVTGIDRWGIEYSDFSEALCEQNAAVEGVANVTFQKGNAVNLSFPDETFDAVTSNFVYHDIPGNRQKYLLETFRTLKKGGTFAIHDLFSEGRYGNMECFMQNLKDSGYEKVELIPTTGTPVMGKNLAYWTMLSSSALLYGVK